MFPPFFFPRSPFSLFTRSSSRQPEVRSSMFCSFPLKARRHLHCSLGLSVRFASRGGYSKKWIGVWSLLLCPATPGVRRRPFHNSLSAFYFLSSSCIAPEASNDRSADHQAIHDPLPRTALYRPAPPALYGARSGASFHLKANLIPCQLSLVPNRRFTNGQRNIGQFCATDAVLGLFAGPHDLAWRR